MITDQNINLKNRIMRRVYLISFIRRVLSPVAVKLYVTAFLFSLLLVNVSVSNVLANTRSFAPGDLIYFYKFAFMNTEILTQISLLGILSLAGLIVFSNLRIILFKQRV